MPVEINMPQLSDTMTEGTVVKWLKKEGDKIKANDIIAEIETDKATMEQEVFDSGTLAYIAAPEGQKVQVGGLIAVLATGSEKIEEIKNKYASGKPAATPAAAPATQSKEEAKPASASSPAAAPAANREDSSRVRISPLARRIATDKGIDPATITGTGPGGRIVQKDVEAAASGPKAAVSPAPSLSARVGSGQTEVIALTKMRSTIALRLQQAKQNIPHFYESIDIDVEELSIMRGKINKQLEKENVRLSLGDFIAKGVAVALLRVPGVNAHFSGDKITRFGDVHLGMAVALPEGLIVPVLRNINQMGIKEIRQRSADLIDRARAQKLKKDELTGATFTVSNLGTYGIKEFSAIINPPEVGILAIAAAEKRPVYRGDQLVGRTIMNVTLSADHRAVDGALAAEFLKTLKGLLEEPGMMLM